MARTAGQHDEWTDPSFLSIEQTANLLKRRKLSPVELVEVALARIERLNPSVNAFITVLAEEARKNGRRAEREIARGRHKGPLHGIPIALKDNIWTRGVRTTAGAKILSDFVPSDDAEVAKRLAEAGSILIGKTNMHEFAYGISNNNPHFGATHNPWNYQRITGGSSGGSAAAVAYGMCSASVCTDTGGSIRIPSALCGIVGLKPTFGLVSVEGIVPLALSLDHAGPVGRTVADVCIMLEALAGEYPKGVPRPDYRKLKGSMPRRFRLAWPDDYFFERIDSETSKLIEAAAEVFRSLGAKIEHVKMPSLADALLPGTNDIALAEATRYHESQGYFPDRAKDYGADVRKRLEQGTQVRAVDYLRGLSMRAQADREFQVAFNKADAIIAPVTAVSAPRIGQEEIEIGGEKETVRSALVRLNRPANFTGHPAISVPCGFTHEGLPVGMQLIGPRWSEAKLLAIALAYEQATEWHTRHPNLS